MNLHDSQLLHPGEELVLGVESVVAPTVVDLLTEFLVTGSSQLFEFLVWSEGGLVDVTSPLNHFKLPGGLTHVQGKNRPGKSLNFDGRSSRCRGSWLVNVLSVHFQDLNHVVPSWSVDWSGVVTTRNLTVERSWWWHLGYH